MGGLGVNRARGGLVGIKEIGFPSYYNQYHILIAVRSQSNEGRVS